MKTRRVESVSTAALALAEDQAPAASPSSKLAEAGATTADAPLLIAHDPATTTLVIALLRADAERTGRESLARAADILAGEADVGGRPPLYRAEIEAAKTLIAQGWQPSLAIGRVATAAAGGKDMVRDNVARAIRRALKK